MKSAPFIVSNIIKSIAATLIFYAISQDKYYMGKNKIIC
jgi:hypothetical protein